jgi:hypothetical protein
MSSLTLEQLHNSIGSIIEFKPKVLWYNNAARLKKDKTVNELYVLVSINRQKNSMIHGCTYLTSEWDTISTTPLRGKLVIVSIEVFVENSICRIDTMLHHCVIISKQANESYYAS